MVAITGMGAVSALGSDLGELRRALLAGEHGIAPIERWDASDFTVRIAAHVSPPPSLPAGWTLGEAYAVAAAKEAWRHSACAVPKTKVGLVLGTMGMIGGRVGAYAERVATELGLGGPRLTVSTACTSSPNAIGLGRDLLLAGECDAVIAGGADELTKELFAGFAALGVLSAGPCAPFSEPYGTTLGEGAGFVVLERSRQGLAHVLGYGLASDAHHPTTPHPRGDGVARAMRSALSDANLPATAIGYVSAHATGTASNDVAEWAATRAVLGEPPVSGSKSQLGHAQGAAGVLELITTVIAAREDVLPPTLRFSRARLRGPADPIARATPPPGRIDAALCASSAFGGANCSVVVSRTAKAEGSAVLRPVYWAGHASAGDWRGAPEGSEHHAPVRSAADLRSIAPRVDPRGTDPAARALIAAAMLAIGGVPLRGAHRDGAGIILGSTRVSPESLRAYHESLEERGYANADTAAFSRVILHAPAGAAATACALRGPSSSIYAGAAGGLAALAYAASCVATRAGVQRMLGAGLDENESDGPLGAACGVLTSAPGPIELAGWAIGKDEATAGRDALERAGTSQPDHHISDLPDPELSAMPSVRSLLSACAAVGRLERAGESALVSGRGDGVGSALVFVRVREKNDEG